MDAPAAVAIGLVIGLLVVLVAALFERVRRGDPAGLQPVAQAVGGLTAEVRGLGERILTLEREQTRVQEGVTALGTGVVESGTVARSLVETTAAMRAELTRAHQDLTALGAEAQAARELDRRTAESVRRLETVIAGTQSKGAAGENILEVVFARLPAEWQVRNLRIGDKTVEFGLRLPNNLVLPIDSKWSATGLVEQLAACEDHAERQRLKVQIESAVRGRAREVRKYLDPSVTVDFAVAAVPDAVHELCAGLHGELAQVNVVLVSYSLFLPYLLLVFQATLRASRQVDLVRLDSYLKSVEGNLAALQAELDGRLSKAITMLQNARDEMSAHLGKVRGGLTRLRLGADGLPAVLPAPGGEAGDGA